MLVSRLWNGLRVPWVTLIITRNKKTVSDPIQQLFVGKLREYRSKSPNGELVEPSPQILKEMKAEFGKLEKHFGGGPGVNMSTFPTFKFDDPKIDPIDEQAPEVKGKGKKKKATTGGPKKKATTGGPKKKATTGGPKKKK